MIDTLINFDIVNYIAMSEIKTPSFFNIVKNSESEATIDIYGDIGESFWSEGFTKETMRDILNNVSDVANIKVNISSFGGSLSDGLVIHDMLKNHPAKITTMVYGFTASAATVIAQAGNSRQMSENAMYLIHQPSTFAMGNVNELEAVVEDLQVINDQLIDFYKKATGMTKTEVKNLIGANNGNGKWLTPQEAKEHGLIDKIVEPSDKKGVQNISKVFLNQYNLPEIPMENEVKNEGIFAEIKQMFGSILDAVRGTENKDNEPKVVDHSEAIAAIEARITEAETLNESLRNEIEANKAEVENSKTEKESLMAMLSEKEGIISNLEKELSAFNKAGAKSTKVGSIDGMEGEGVTISTLNSSLTQDLANIRKTWNMEGIETKGNQNPDKTE